MNISKLSQRTFGLVLIALLLAGCEGVSVVPTATPTIVPPTPTVTAVPATPTPTSAPGPKAGFWEGKEEIQLGEVRVSFQIAGDGYIHDFSLAMSIKFFACTVDVQKIPINADGTFVYSENGKNYISGKFDGDTSVTITFGTTPILCKEGLKLTPEEVQTTHAKWRGQ